MTRTNFEKCNQFFGHLCPAGREERGRSGKGKWGGEVKRVDGGGVGWGERERERREDRRDEEQ